MDNHEHDVERVTKLMRGLVENMYADCAEAGLEDVRIDQIGIVGIVAFKDPEGDEAEDVFTAFETKRPHVKLGILTAVINGHKKEFS